MTVQADVRADWAIELNCDCPGCKEYVDLLTYADFWDGLQLDIGEHDTDCSRALAVICPQCGHEFEVCCVY